jgi:hypothetical protein
MISAASSRQFRDILDVVVIEEPAYVERLQDSEKVLRMVVLVLGGKSFSRHLSSFLEKHPSMADMEEVE